MVDLRSPGFGRILDPWSHSDHFPDGKTVRGRRSYTDLRASRLHEVRTAAWRWTHVRFDRGGHQGHPESQRQRFQHHFECVLHREMARPPAFGWGPKPHSYVLSGPETTPIRKPWKQCYRWQDDHVAAFDDARRPVKVDGGQLANFAKPLASGCRDFELERVWDSFGAVQAGRDLDWQEPQPHVRPGDQNHFHLPDEVQRFPHGYSTVQIPGKTVSVFFFLYSKILKNSQPKKTCQRKCLFRKKNKRPRYYSQTDWLTKMMLS